MRPSAALPCIVAPDDAPGWVRDAVEAGGGRLETSEAEALVWFSELDDPALLERLLEGKSGIRWVQLPWAGTESYAHLIDGSRLWTCGKGLYGEAVAEHALTLALAGFRLLRSRLLAQAWGPPEGRTLFDRRVTILGGGGIARALLRLLEPLRIRVTIVRRQADPIPGAERVVSQDGLHEAMADADLVVLALALTPETRGIIGAEELRLMREDAWLVNVARGAHVITADLVRALQERWIAGAALDVTDPEPLPDGHVLWRLDNCIVTPHTAGPSDMVRDALARRIADNVRRYAAGEPLEGQVNPALTY